MFLDGFAPGQNPDLWSPDLLRQVARLSRPGATLATWSTAGHVRQALTAAGYVCHKRPGFGGKRERLEAHYQPRWHPPRPAAFQPVSAQGNSRHAVIVGGGLAGASAAQALARRGWRCTVLDAADQPAGGASGNPAGLLHGIVHPEDGSHARWLRSAALFAHRQMAPLLAQELLPGHLAGFVRLHETPAEALQRQLDAQGLEARYVQALDPAAIQALLGVDAAAGTGSPSGLLFPHGGWVSPAALVRHWLQAPGITWRGGVRVQRLQAVADGGSSPRWRVLDEHGHAQADAADAVVLANADGALPLLQRSLAEAEAESPLWWAPALRAQRGQISRIAASALASLPSALQPPLPRLPLSRFAYALDTHPSQPGAGELVFGATHQWDDADGAVREHDHHENLHRLLPLLGQSDSPEALAAWQALPWSGRTGWRCLSPDRLPLLGRVPCLQPSDERAARRPHASQHLDRVAGLYLYTALGSRGLTLAPLLGESLACLISGEALPVDTRLLAALDPARFALAQRAKS